METYSNFAVVNILLPRTAVRNYLARLPIYICLTYLISFITMEIICTIVEQQKPREVTYVDKQGQQKKFPSVCVVLRYGGDWISCEATYELADYLVKNPLQTRVFYMARLVWRTSDYTDSNGASRTRCEAKLTSIVEM